MTQPDSFSVRLQFKVMHYQVPIRVGRHSVFRLENLQVHHIERGAAWAMIRLRISWLFASSTTRTPTDIGMSRESHAQNLSASNSCLQVVRYIHNTCSVIILKYCF